LRNGDKLSQREQELSTSLRQALDSCLEAIDIFEKKKQKIGSLTRIDALFRTWRVQQRRKLASYYAIIGIYGKHC
jgi:hypothetical protein